MLNDFFNLDKKKWYFNRYMLVLFFFIIWMAFFDRSKWTVRQQLNTMVDDLHGEVDEYKEKIIQTKEDKIDLENNLEKYAREKYYMHKEDEEVFIIDKKKKDNNERSSK